MKMRWAKGTWAYKVNAVFMNRTSLSVYTALSLLLVLGVGPSALAMRVALPLPAVVAGSDLIVTGTVVAEGKAAEAAIVPPGAAKPVKRWYRAVKVKVEAVHFGQGELAAKVRAGSTIPIIAWAQPPQPKGQPRMIVSDGPDYPSLRKGARYVLVVRAMPERKSFYLQPDARLCIQMTPQTLERADALIAAANVEQWAWGEVKGGLQIAFVPETRKVSQVQAQRGRGAPKFKYAHVTYVVAVRNVSPDTVALNHFADDRFLSMRLLRPGRPDLPLDLYKGMNKGGKPFDDTQSSVIDPGTLFLLARYGKGPYGDYVQLETDPGDVHIAVTFRSTRRGKGARGLPLWVGELTSGATPITILANP